MGGGWSGLGRELVWLKGSLGTGPPWGIIGRKPAMRQEQAAHVPPCPAGRRRAYMGSDDHYVGELAGAGQCGGAPQSAGQVVLLFSRVNVKASRL